MLEYLLMICQLVFSGVICLYFVSMLKNQKANHNAIIKESEKQLSKLNKMRSIKLSTPLSERTRPTNINQIVGQKEGIEALIAAICGPNPQHVIIYGPAGVGKTAAARVVMDMAKRMDISPFLPDAKFIEADATTMRFDERSVADALIGSVHDPIYQGAGAYGPAGIPQPKPGAVSKAHGGILFLDEIGELHPIQFNRLLKVLEDRRVFFESAYYTSEDKSIPPHIHDIFKNGLPADFRMIGATTKGPESIPEAIRSRCIEIYFSSLNKSDLIKIIDIAQDKLNISTQAGVNDLICNYAKNGRDAVNIMQIAASHVIVEKRNKIMVSDIEWVIETCRLSLNIDMKINPGCRVGCVNALAVSGLSEGRILEIEVSSAIAKNERGNINVTGIVEEETFDASGRHLSRRSSARASVENVITLLDSLFNLNIRKYDIHINFPGGLPVDGPSAGIAIFSAIYSSITKIPIDNTVAMTGEVSIYGYLKPIGGVLSKIKAAMEAGVLKVYIPKDNYHQRFKDLDIEVIAVGCVSEIINDLFGNPTENSTSLVYTNDGYNVISASPAQNS